MSQSIPYQLSAAIVAALVTEFEPDGAVVRDNPRDPSALAAGTRVVFVEDADDDLINKPGQAEGRSFGLTVGVINRTVDDRSGADADMLRVKAALQGAVFATGRALVAAKALTACQAPREGRRTYKVEGIDVGGALILARFEIDYRTPSSAR